MTVPSQPAPIPEPALPVHPARRLLNGTGRAALRVGRAVAEGYRAVDPDLRRHLAQLPLAGLSGLIGRASALEAQPDDGRRVLVFVHGLGGHPGNFVGLRTWLRRKGRTRQYALALTGSDATQPPDLEAMATQLALALREIVRVNDLQDAASIDLVAHSMGGLVARLALREADVAASVAHLVTLGTPHGGTWIARYADTVLTRALRPSSATLQQLAEQLPWPGPPALPRLSAFWSNADMMLLPHETACVPGADNHELAGATHFGYLLRPAAWQRIAETLEQ